MDEATVAERVAILRRFREMLQCQRGKFSAYLEILDKQKGDIEKEDVDSLVKHVELEQSIVAEIFTFQRVIDPLDAMYKAAYPDGKAPSDIGGLKRELEDMRTSMLRKNEENRVLLRQRMGMLRQEISGIRKPFLRANSVYGQAGEASLIDIKG